MIPAISISMSRINIFFSKVGHEKSFITSGSCLTYLSKVDHHFLVDDPLDSLVQFDNQGETDLP